MEKRSKSCWKPLLTGLAILGLVIWGIAWLYTHDEPEPDAPYWVRSVEREPMAVAAMEELHTIEPQFEDRTYRSVELVELSGNGWKPSGDWEEVRQVLEANASQLGTLRALMQKDAELHYQSEPVSYWNDADGGRVNRPLQLFVLLKLASALAAHDGHQEEALKIALESLRLAKQLTDAKGEFVRFISSTTTYRLALVNVYSSLIGLEDPMALRELVTGLPPLEVGDTAIVEAVLSEYEWAKTAGDRDWDLREVLENTPLLGFEDPSGRFFWFEPEYFHRKNETRRLTLEAHTEHLENAALPTIQWRTSVLDQLNTVEGNRVFRQMHPNAVGHLLAWQGYVLFEDWMLLHRSSQLMLRLMQTVAAVRAYELEKGSLPPDLRALVPGYVKAVPKDPYDRQPVRYRPLERIVYGVGIDGNAPGVPSINPFSDPGNPTLTIPGGAEEIEEEGQSFPRRRRQRPD